MSEDLREDVTTLLRRWQSGDKAALERLMPLVYDELRRIAARHLRNEQSDHTLQSRELVHEAYMRMVDGAQIEYSSKRQFCAVAATIIRNILVDHARRKKRLKRGGDGAKVGLDIEVAAAPTKPVDLEQLDLALSQLARFDERQSRIVELRFFGGLSIEETADVLSISPATVKREWTVAKTWIFDQMNNRGSAQQLPH